MSRLLNRSRALSMNNVGNNYVKESRMFRTIVFLIALVMVLTVTSKAEAKKGFYIGAGATYNTINGDFDGHSGLEGGTEVIIMPDINNAFGFDVLGGYGISDHWAIELNFMSSGHRGTWETFSGDVSYSSFSVNGKYSLATSGTVQPYLLFGVSYNGLMIKQGAADLFTGETGDATFTGPGLNFGTGVDIYVSPNLSLTPGVMFRYVDYTDAEGVHGSGSVSGGTDGSGLSLLLTAAYHF